MVVILEMIGMEFDETGNEIVALQVFGRRSASPLIDLVDQASPHDHGATDHVIRKHDPGIAEDDVSS